MAAKLKAAMHNLTNAKKMWASKNPSWVFRIHRKPTASLVLFFNIKGLQVRLRLAQPCQRDALKTKGV
jgi:hypothetical protein